MYDEDEVEMDYGYFHYLCDSKSINGSPVQESITEVFLSQEDKLKRGFYDKGRGPSQGSAAELAGLQKNLWSQKFRDCNAWMYLKVLERTKICQSIQYWIHEQFLIGSFVMAGCTEPDGCKRVSWWECKQ